MDLAHPYQKFLGFSEKGGEGVTLYIFALLCKVYWGPLGSEFENIIWSEIGSGFGEPRGSPLSKFPRDSSEQRWRKRMLCAQQNESNASE